MPGDRASSGRPDETPRSRVSPESLAAVDFGRAPETRLAVAGAVHDPELRATRPACEAAQPKRSRATGFETRARLHFMLRPVRSRPPKVLSSVGFSRRNLSRSHCDPATRRSCAYRDGTCTYWRGAASRSVPDGSGLVCVATHHGRAYLGAQQRRSSPSGKSHATALARAQPSCSASRRRLSRRRCGRSGQAPTITSGTRETS